MSFAINKPTTLDTSKVERDSKNTEYEIKLECLDTGKGLFDFLDDIEIALDSNTHWCMSNMR